MSTLSEVTFSIEDIDFGGIYLGEISYPKELMLTNSGIAPLIISSISISSNFVVESNCSDSMPVGGSCILYIQFSPAIIENMTGTLNVRNNTISVHDTISLTGIGIRYDEPAKETPSVDANAADIQFYHDFNDEELHTHTVADILTTWKAGTGAGLRTNAVNIVPDPDPSGTHGNVMQVFYAANESGLKGSGGSQSRTIINDSHADLYFAYDAFFTEDGGHTEKWAPSTDLYIYLDNFIVSALPITNL